MFVPHAGMMFYPGGPQLAQPPAAKYFSIDVECVATGTGAWGPCRAVRRAGAPLSLQACHLPMHCSCGNLACAAWWTGWLPHSPNWFSHIRTPFVGSRSQPACHWPFFLPGRPQRACGGPDLPCGRVRARAGQPVRPAPAAGGVLPDAPHRWGGSWLAACWSCAVEQQWQQLEWCSQLPAVVCSCGWPPMRRAPCPHPLQA